MLSVSLVCSQCLAELGLGTGRRLVPVCASSGTSPVCGPFANLPAFKTGEHRMLRCSGSDDRALSRPLYV